MMYSNPQTQALMDHYDTTRGTQGTSPTNTPRVMPGMTPPVQPIQAQTSGQGAFPVNNRMTAPVNALADYYRQGLGAVQGGPAPTQQGAMQVGDVPGSAGQWSPTQGGPPAQQVQGMQQNPQQQWLSQDLQRMQAQNPQGSPIAQPQPPQSRFVTTPNTPSVNYGQPMSPQVQALRNFYRQ